MVVLLSSMDIAGRWELHNTISRSHVVDVCPCYAPGQQLPGEGQKQTREAYSQLQAVERPAPACASDIPVFAVISACKAAVAQSASAFQLQQVLQSFSHSIREQGWTVLIAECGKRGEPEKAQQVFDAVPTKNVWHYSSLISAFGACGHWRAALELLERLKQLAGSEPRLQPNHVTYSATIVACAKGGRVDHVQRIFKEMLTAGLEPDSVTYYIMLSTCSRLGAWDVVKSLLQTMHEQGQAARSSVYQTYIRHLCRTSQWSHAVTVFQAMQDLGVPATSDIITELLAALNRCSKPWTAAYLLMQAADLDLVECDYLCDATYEALARAGSARSAQRLHQYVSSCRNTAPASPDQQLGVEVLQRSKLVQDRQGSVKASQSPGQQQLQQVVRQWQPTYQSWQHRASPQQQHVLQPRLSPSLSYSPSSPSLQQWQPVYANRMGWGCVTPPLVPPPPTRQGLVFPNRNRPLVPSHPPYHHSGPAVLQSNQQFATRRQPMQPSSSAGNALWSSGAYSDASSDRTGLETQHVGWL